MEGRIRLKSRITQQQREEKGKKEEKGRGGKGKRRGVKDRKFKKNEGNWKRVEKKCLNLHPQRERGIGIHKGSALTASRKDTGY